MTLRTAYRSTSLLALALITFWATGLASSPVAAEPLSVYAAQPAVKVSPETVDALNAFSYKVYLPVAAKEANNLAVSPLGSYLLLGLLWEGAAGATRQEIASVTGLSGPRMAEISSMTSSLDARESLDLAQRIYRDTSTKLVPAYLKKVSSLVDHDVPAVPFRDDPAKAVKTINAWVAERTRGRIPELLSPLSRDTLVVLVSTLSFRGEWRSPFAVGFTRPGNFQGRPMAPMMIQGDIPTFKVKGAEGIVLSYQEDFDMVFLLPAPGQSVDDLAVALADSPLPLIATSQRVTVELPRFEFTTPTLSLTQAWSKAGLTKTITAPDLSGMLMAPVPGLKVLHQTYVRVDEKGTEAAAATAASSAITMAISDEAPQRVLAFDRPFLFFLRHSGTGTILMMGRVVQPEVWVAPVPGARRPRPPVDSPPLPQQPTRPTPSYEPNLPKVQNKPLPAKGVDPDVVLYLPLGRSASEASLSQSLTESSGLEPYPDRKGDPTGASSITGIGYIKIARVESTTGLKELTLSAWVRPARFDTHGTILSRVTPNRDFNLQVDDRGRVLTHIQNQGYEFAYSKGAIPKGKWTFVAATFKDLTWKIYINGILDSTTTVTKLPAWESENVTVGNIVPFGPEPFPGALDDIRVHRRALTAAQIVKLMEL